MSDRKQTGRGMFGKGYSIALILCAAASGISGYMYYRNANKTQDTLQTPVQQADAPQNQQPDVAVVATQPQQTQPTEDNGTEPTSVPKGPLKTAAPVSGELVAGYAMDCLSYNETTRDWRIHNGVDFAAPEGTPVTAAADGVVYTTYTDDAMGTTVVIRHDGGYTTVYSSLSEDLAVKAGDKVTLGQTIGTVGSTALLENALSPHVHFSVSYRDSIVDPMEFLGLN